MPKVVDAVAYIGHQVHVMRRREVGQLLDWLGTDLTGQRVLDVAGGDGYWAGQAGCRGARAVNIDLMASKVVRGTKLKDPPVNLIGDALRLPFPDGWFDAVMSVCAIEHFADGGEALDEMARVLRPGGSLVMSADALTRRADSPALYAGHAQRYHVVRTYDREQLTEMLSRRGFEVLASRYMFRGALAEKVYLNLSRHRLAWNAAAPLSPLLGWADRRSTAEGGSVLLVHARRR